MATEFDRHVAETLNVAMPAAEAAAGHALLPSERLEVVGLVRQALLRGDTSSIEALKRRCGAFTETTPPAATLTEAAPTTSAPVAAKRDPAYEKAIRTELLQRCQVGRLLVGRALTAEEQADLEQAIRERAAAAAPVTETTSRHPFGEAVMAGRLGPARSPFFALPVARTADQISEDAAIPGFKDGTSAELARMPWSEGSQEFRQRLTGWAMNVPFGGQPLS